MPQRQDLPPSLAPLASRQALTLSHESFATDCTRVIDTIEDLSGSQQPRAVDLWADPDYPAARSALLQGHWAEGDRGAGTRAPPASTPEGGHRAARGRSPAAGPGRAGGAREQRLLRGSLGRRRRGPGGDRRSRRHGGGGGTAGRGPAATSGRQPPARHPGLCERRRLGSCRRRRCRAVRAGPGGGRRRGPRDARPGAAARVRAGRRLPPRRPAARLGGLGGRRGDVRRDRPAASRLSRRRGAPRGVQGAGAACRDPRSATCGRSRGPRCGARRRARRRAGGCQSYAGRAGSPSPTGTGGADRLPGAAFPLEPGLDRDRPGCGRARRRRRGRHRVDGR